MATTIAPPRSSGRPQTTGEGRDGSGGSGRFGGDHGPGAIPWSVPDRAYHTGMWMGIAGIVMVFAAFTSALVVRRGLSTDWVQTSLPHILYLNTVILMASSLTLELSRRSLRMGRGQAFSRWLYLTVVLSIFFVAGQLAAWRELASRGVYLATNPSSSFFYLLTAAHGIHLVGGISALLVLAYRARTIAAGGRRVSVEVTSIYWHFMDCLWVYLLILLMVRL